MPRVLIVDDDAGVRSFCRRALEGMADIEADTANDGRDGLARCRARPYEVVLTDVMMPETSGFDLLRALRAEQPGVEVVVMTGHGTIERAIEAMRGGASEFLQKPISVDLLQLTIGRCLERAALRREISRLKAGADGTDGFGRLIGRGPAMRSLFALIETLARVDATVLVLGETGTGKELVARELHRASDRAGGPFVAVACGAIPETLIESELFGHRKGAFTGASQDRAGRIEAAAGGTLFLDEIGEVPLAVQHKLLRVLQEKEVERLGDTRPLQVDVRIVAATHRDLEAEMREGRFREDLFYRLSVVPIRVPPLRERPEDVPLLASSFLARFADRFKKRIGGIGRSALEALQAHDWPGNVRELEHAIERAVVMTTGDELREIPLVARRTREARPSADGTATDGVIDLSIPWEETRRLGLERLESAYLRAALARHRGHLAAVARAAGISSRTLYEKMRLYGLRKERFRRRAQGAAARSE